MHLQDWLSTADISAIFTEEITAAGGTVTDTFDDATRLFTRSILPQTREVRKKDRVQSGVALRATGGNVWVHPYVFRQVCRNGAIMAHAIESLHVEELESPTTQEAASAVRAAVQACCISDAFATAADAMRQASMTPVDHALSMLPMFSRMPKVFRDQLLREVLDRFFQEPDRSRFGLLNAVTSVARDMRNPQLRWRLEELGGGMLIGRLPTIQPDDAAAELAVR